MKQYNIQDDVLIIPEGVKELTSKIIKNQRSEFKKVYISSSVEKIEYNTFCNNCVKLQEIVVSPDNPYFSSIDGVLYSKDKLTLVRYPKGKKDVEFSIPLGVTEISSHAFCKCRLIENIVTPSSLETIGICAFNNLSIVKLTIENNVSERIVTMLKAWINHIEIGSSVKCIINGAFDIIGGLKEIKVSIDNSNYSSEDGVLFSKDRTKLIKFPQYKDLKHYSIPNCVREICDYAFYGCKYLEVVEIPKEVKFISTSAFGNCESLKEIKLSSENNDYINKDGFLFDRSMTKLLWVSKLIKELIHYSIPNGVTVIGDSAFTNCTSLQSIDIPNSVKVIGADSFYCCSSLQSIDIPSSVEIIGDSSFENCSSLQSIDIPNSVKKIGERAFFNCSSLQSIDIPSSVKKIGERAFFNCSSLHSIDIPRSVEVIGKNSFQYCHSLQNIDIPNSVTVIGDRAFSDCTSMQNVDIPNSVKDIGEGAFENCKSMRNIDIPNSVEVIGEGTFRDCTSLLNVDIPNSIKKIGERAFIGCSSLQSITVPNSVEEIESSAFNACSSLLEILVSLDNDYYMSDNGILFNKNGTSLLRVPIGMNLKQYSISTKVKSIGDRAFSGCNSLQGVDIPSSVTEIGEYAFAACSSLQGIEIPDSVKEIGKGTFLNCNSLQTVEIPNGVTEIKPMSFAFCSSLESIEIPNSVMSLSDFSAKNLRKIIIHIEDIDKCEVTELKGVNFNDCILYVPSGTRWSYRHHPVFGKFKNIEILHAKR